MADERVIARRLVELRARVTAVRAVVATTPGLAEMLRRNWPKAARFYAKFGMKKVLLRHGVPVEEVRVDEDLIDRLQVARGNVADV